MNKYQVLKWYTGMLGKFLVVSLMVAYYSAEFFTSII